MRRIEKQIKEYIEYCEKVRNLSPKTIANYKDILVRLSKDVPVSSINKITNQMVEDFMKKQNWCGANSNRNLTSIKTAFRHFAKRGEKLSINLDALERVKEEPSRAVFYTKAEIDEVLSICCELDWLLVRISFEGGLRIRELVNLKPSDLKGNRITFIGKGRVRREVYISEETRLRLISWISEHPLNEWMWMWEKDGVRHQYTNNGIRIRMRKVFRECGHDDFYPHALRHSFATHILHEGAPVTVVKEMMGHSQIRTTMNYIHQIEGRLERAFSEFGVY